ncbi:DNA-processing protein DprA [Microbacterium oleivorans]|uniref:DNA-protecting protein DprA n=1 Tax=Microbacterium oleivorans TaxID=273677 RepID=A0A7D5EQL7_9MICO|nr:DNA-processing protein DprA [Microbacterium oleivorans]QLD10365.1 DNA-protecting protein DprA [Microbacterium oleivorans]
MKPAELRASLRSLARPEQLADGEAVAERYARARWSVLAEPGDAVAGLAVARLGAAAALEAALGGGPAPETLELADRDWSRALGRWQPRRDDHTYPIELAQRVGARLVIPGDADWPTRLDDLGVHAPFALWVRGRASVLAGEAPAVALVGARAATSYGVRVTAEIAGDLAARGATIVSGAAFGIDAAAHRASIAVGGQGIAVLAGGVEKAYPAAHGELLTGLSRQGAVISEVPCGTAPTKWRFLQRNRVIAALADATVVVEAGWRSGSLNTAGHAASLGRALGAVPGPVTSAASAGCHRILREYDGHCITSADDVRELIGWSPDDPPSTDPGAAASRTDDTTRILDALSARTPRQVSEVARRSGLPAEEATALLGLLALEGRAEVDPRGWRRPRS